MDRDRLGNFLHVAAIALVVTWVLILLASAIIFIGKAVALILVLLLLVGVVIYCATPETKGKAPDGTKYGGMGS